jgi:hypothetical protein
LDALVTPSHEMVAGSHRGHGWPDLLGKVRADRVSPEARLLVAPSDWWGDDVQTFTIPFVEFEPSGRHHNLSRHADPVPPIAMDDWLEFLGYFIAEGYVRAAKTPPYEFGLVQKVGPVADRIQSCLSRLPFRFGHRMDGDKHRWRANSKAAWTYLRDHVGQGANNKRIPRTLLGCSGRQLHILLDALVAGDGSGPTVSGRRAYYSISPGLLDDVQEVALRLGYRAHISGDRLAMAERTTSIPMNPRKVDYRGMVYCFTVPNGTLVTRRNGKPLVSGNSGFWGAWRPVGLAGRFMDLLRAGYDGWICLQPDPRPSRLAEIRVEEWLAGGCDALAGQHYWTDFQVDAAAELRRAADLAREYGVPVYPTLPGNAALASFPLQQIAEFPGFVVWRYRTTPLETMLALAGAPATMRIMPSPAAATIVQHEVPAGALILEGSR